MTIVGMVGAGQMGSGLGWALRRGGHEVVATLSGRSARSGDLARQAGLTVLPDLDAVVSAADVVLVVTPPDAAPNVAVDIVTACGRTAARPLVADLNAISPSTVEAIGATLAGGGLNLVDGSISGPSPSARPGAIIYLSGPRAQEIKDLQWTHVRPVVVGGQIGSASAVKMCTASVYKGLVGLFAQAMRTAAHHGVLDTVVADLADSGHEPALQVAVGVTKAHRFVPEMREIALTQSAAGLPASLFDAFAEVYAQLALTPWARQSPEAVHRSVSARDLVVHLSSRDS